MDTRRPVPNAGRMINTATRSRFRFPAAIAVVTCVLAGGSVAAAAEETFPVAITVDAGRPLGVLRPIWRYFGADEPNYAYLKDGRKLLSELGAMAPKDVFFRAHNMLCTGDGTPHLKWGSSNAYTEDAQGRAIYDWTITDRIFDTYLERGVRPYVQFGFMPRAMSVHPDPYEHHWQPGQKYGDIYLGWAYPPKDYAKWEELCRRWTEHCVSRYGRAETETWWWELWNEPNIGYWQGTPEEFHRLYDHTVAGVRHALPTARIGGPETAGGPGGRFLGQFLEHCARGTNAATGRIGTALDLISFHAKGQPQFVDGHVRMGISHQLQDIDKAMAVVAGFPEYRKTPIVIGESDPEGCAACQGPQNGYRNGTMYSSYTAASFARKHELAAKHQVNLEGALTWAFEFEDQPYFAGFRVLASHGIDHPVLNTFRLMSRMSGQRLTTESDGAVSLESILREGVRQRPDVQALAALNGKRLTILVWHYHDDDLAGPAAQVSLAITGLPGKTGNGTMTEYRIDAEHSNAYVVWQKMGRPAQPSAEQHRLLEQAGQLATMGESRVVPLGKTSTQLNLMLPRQGVSLVQLDLP